MSTGTIDGANVGDSMEPFKMLGGKKYTWWPSAGRYVRGTQLNPQEGYVKCVPYARAVWEHVNGPIPPKCMIHHNDGDKSNDSIENLSCVSAREHKKLHAALRKTG